MSKNYYAVKNRSGWIEIRRKQNDRYIIGFAYDVDLDWLIDDEIEDVQWFLDAGDTLFADTAAERVKVLKKYKKGKIK